MPALPRVDGSVRELRPEPLSEARPTDALVPLGVELETERRKGGTEERVATVFLTGAECPFACVYCDLWKFTLKGATPPGALPGQLVVALKELGDCVVDRLKLYNASNFFDSRAVPPEDDDTIIGLLDSISNVTVECHPRLIGERCFAFADALEGQLEVAIGLETANPEAHALLNKGCTLDQTLAGVARLRERGIPWRAFALVGVPFVPADEQLEWVVRTVDLAATEGADSISLIPVRGGNGELERLAREGKFSPPDRDLIEAALRATLEDDRLAVQLDPWNLRDHMDCASCAQLRVARLERMNLSGLLETEVRCSDCGS